MTVCIAFVRHGPTDWNREHRLQGRADIPLSDAGRAEVLGWRLPACLADIPWRVSPLRRAIETAELLGLATLETDRRLIEMDWGEWEGRRVADLRRDLGEAMTLNEARGLDMLPPDGESPRQVQDRLRPFLRSLCDGPPLTGAVSHKGVIRALLALATGWDMRGKPEVRLDWRAVHVFSVDREGRLAPHRLNLPLTADGPR
jgi:broad specificity phosphatase PhoE